MPPKRKRAAVVEEKEIEKIEDDDSDDSTKAKASEKPNTKRKRAIKHNEEKSDEDEIEKKPVKKTRGRNAKKVVAKSESDESEPEEVAKPAKKGRNAKKHSSEENSESEIEEKPTKRGKAPVKKDATSEDEEEMPLEDEKPTKSETEESDYEEKPAKKAKATKKAAKPAAKKAKEPKAKADGDKPKAKNQTSTAYTDLDFNSCKQSEHGSDWNFKISNWNVDGIRAWLKKGGLEYVEYEKPDIFCLQETKCSEPKLPPEVEKIDGYKVYWHCSKKEGYAGVGLYSKTEPMSVTYGLGAEEYDDEGRMITAEYDKFYVISVYVPNAGRGLVTLPKRLEWNEEFRKYVGKLDAKKPVIICGDMNVAHTEIDLANPKTNMKNAGFTKEEREGMTEFLSDGYVDTFRKLYPDKTKAYTFWSYMSNSRAKNTGWRLDYFIVSERFADSVCDNIIRDQVFGSDHCPIALFLNV